MKKKILNKYKYNIFFAYISHFLMAFSSAWAVISILFYEKIGINYEEIAFLLAITPLITMILELVI